MRKPFAVVKTISGGGAICNGTNKVLTLATGFVSSIQWQSSTTSATATDFADISGANDPVTLTVSPSGVVIGLCKHNLVLLFN